MLLSTLPSQASGGSTRRWAMKKILTTVFLLSLGAPASAAPSLVGKWQSDRELTMSFIKEHVRLEDKTYTFLNDIMGQLTLTFSRDKVSSSLPDSDVTIAGKVHHMVGFNEQAPYAVIYASDRVVVTSGVEPVTHTAVVTTYNFDSPDVMWIYTGGADNALPNSHYREYFRRVPQD